VPEAIALLGTTMISSYLNAVIKARSRLRRIDCAPIAGTRDEIRMFIIVRNEGLRLPFMLDYYRRLGVDRIFAVENNSTDDTLSILLAQERTHVFQTCDDYSGHWAWMEYLLETHGRGHWCLVVDADEILIYPRWEDISIRDLCRFLDLEGSTALCCLLLDLYSAEPFDQLRYRPGDDPLEMRWYYDPDSHRKVEFRVPNPKTGQEFCCEACLGGVRYRVLGASPALTKVPLVRWGRGTYLIQGMHAADNVAFSPVEGAVLHFKFLQDFVPRVLYEADRGQHWNEAHEYRIMARGLAGGGVSSFHSPHSQLFAGPEQLTAAGLMRDSPDLRDYARHLENDPAGVSGVNRPSPLRTCRTAGER
jgi:glycosyltransferase involved in cell wall biosynthesis